MAADKTTETSGGREIPLWRDEHVLRAAAQVVSAILIIGALAWIGVNFALGANQRGMALNFRFLSNPAEFPISDPVLPYDPSRSFGYAFLVGLVKTLLVSVVGIFFSTILGTFLGLARLSTNWLLNKIALAYIEFHRNIPLLVLLFIWYFPVFSQLPPVEESVVMAGPSYLNSRGIYLAWPRLTSQGIIWVIFLFLGVASAIAAWIGMQRRQVITGKVTYYGLISLALLVGLPVIGWLLAGSAPLELDVPYLDGYNYRGGLRLTPEFTALLIGLTMYTAAFIAEVVRAGIQAVSRGQLEAARAVGLRQFQVLRFVIIPQAMRVIIPPMISQYLNLTKNSSLAFFIGYQEVFSVGKIAINQAGRAVPVFAMVMAVYLMFSLITSITLNWYNRRIQFVER
ncbi:MAG: ABC transporter permease subunit [Anaerolineales bacterium]|nr:ABC transporter permease subunit [Anaerolineales bacterium]